MNELTNECPYELGKDMKYIEDIDHGAFGTVIHVLELLSNKDLAVKVINKSGASAALLKKLKEEVAILKQLQHENIVKFYGCKETNTQLLIKMEYIKYGTLSHWIKDHHKISEYDASIIIKKVLSAVEYLHSKQICHRDIKPENIMISKENDLSSIKIIDFGLSVQHFNYLSHNDYCGTFIYMAPEQIEKKLYYLSVDIWSIGILMYMLLNNGKHPFYKKGDKKQDFINKIKNGKIKYVNKLSFMAKNLIEKLCEPNPSRRYSAFLAAKHPWITRNKYDEIPMTFNDILVKNNNKKNAINFLMISVFLNYYKKKETIKKAYKECSSFRISYDVVIKKPKIKLYKIDAYYINQCKIISKNEKQKLLKQKEKCLEILSTDEEDSFEKNQKIHKNLQGSRNCYKSTEKYITAKKKEFLENNEDNNQNLIFNLHKRPIIKRLTFKKKYKIEINKNKIIPNNLMENNNTITKLKEILKTNNKIKTKCIPLMEIPTANNLNDDQIKKVNTIKANKNRIINIINNNNGNNENEKSKSISKLNENNFTGEKITEPYKKINDVSTFKSNKSISKYYLKANLPKVTSNKNLNLLKHRKSDNLIRSYNIKPVQLPFIGLRPEEKEIK